MPGQLGGRGSAVFLIGDGDSHLLMQHNGLHKGLSLYRPIIRKSKKKAKYYNIIAVNLIRKDGSNHRNHSVQTGRC